MDYHGPPPSGYPPPSYPSWPQSNGHESMFLGTLLGELKSGQSQTITALQAQTQVLREIHGQLTDNAALMESRLPAPAASTVRSGDRLTWRDWAQIILAGLVVIGAIAGRLSPREAFALIGKPLGF